MNVLVIHSQVSTCNSQVSLYIIFCISTKLKDMLVSKSTCIRMLWTIYVDLDLAWQNVFLSRVNETLKIKVMEAKVICFGYGKKNWIW